MEGVTEEAVKEFHKLFKSSYIENCQIDDEVVGLEDLETLDELDFGEVCDNLKELLAELLQSKRNLKNLDTQETARTNEMLESQIQKLEQEVRTHIGIE
ncbi:MAG: hypothetical protein V2I33_17975 [Kangiellaceae bacterium]|jgi:hypothetical protein|nr:hypothetical protein [Kangiellaceae bacterium]